MKETQSYTNEREWRDAMKRGSQRHSNGWRQATNSKNKLEITWINDPIPPEPNQTEKDRLKVLGQKIDDDSITTREFIEYERIKRKIESDRYRI